MWTKDQNNAIHAPVGNLLVTAAAGSGKTAVMVERIINRIVGDNPTDVDRMLVVTYTNAAAAEIKERIMAEIIKKLEEKEDEDHLQLHRIHPRTPYQRRRKNKDRLAGS